MPEGEERGEVALLEAAVADVDALRGSCAQTEDKTRQDLNHEPRYRQSFQATRLEDRTQDRPGCLPIASYGEMSTRLPVIMPKTMHLRECQSKLSRRVDFAEQDIGQTVSELVSAVERLHRSTSAYAQDQSTMTDLDQRPCLVRPGHGHGRARLVDDDGFGVRGEHLADEAVREPGELHVCAVKALAFPATRGYSVDGMQARRGGHSLVVQPNHQDRRCGGVGVGQLNGNGRLCRNKQQERTIGLLRELDGVTDRLVRIHDACRAEPDPTPARERGAARDKCRVA